MADDFSLDPLQIQEDELNKQQARLTAMRLRNTNVQPNDIYGQVQRAYTDSSGAVQDQQIAGQRQQLGDAYQKSLTEALRGAPDEIKAMVMSPGTRKEGIDLWKKMQSQKIDQDDLDKTLGRGKYAAAPSGPSMGGNAVAGGGTMPTYAEASAMALSANPTTAARGKQILDQMKPQDPKNMVTRNAHGGYDMIEGGLDAYNKSQGAQWAQQHPGGYQVPDGKGGMVTMPAPGVGAPSALPNATGAGAPPTPGGAPISPASAPSALPRATGASPPGFQVPPEVQKQRDGMKLQVLTQELQGELAKKGTPEYDGERTERNIRALQSEIQQTLKQSGIPADQLAQQAHAAQGQPGQPAGVPSALPMSTGQGVPQPDAGMGRTNPIAQDIYKQGAEQNQTQQRTMEEKSAIGGKILNQLGTIRNLNKAPTWTGGAAGLPMTLDSIASTFTGGTTDKTNNTQQLDAAIQNTLGPLLKEYGYNPSNRDLTVAAKRLPSISQDPRVRDRILTDIENGVKAEIQVNGQARSMMDAAARSGISMSPKQALEQSWMMYNKQRDEQEAVARGGNPTQPGSSALSGSRAAAEASVVPGPEDTSGGFKGYMGDLVNNAKSLPGALFSKSGVDAAKDAWGNMLEGDKQFFGMGDREAWRANQDQQDARAKTDPKYAQARVFHDTANPNSLLYGEGSLVKNVAGAALQGALRPADTWNDQVITGGMTGAVAAPFAAASKAVPSTRAAPGINLEGEADRLMKLFPSFRPTSSQLNPGVSESAIARGLGFNDAASLAQTKAITKDLMGKAGIAGEQLTPKAIAETEDQIGQAFDKILPKGVKVKVDTTNAQALTDAIKRVPGVEEGMAKTPALASVYNALQSGNPALIPANVLHNAWKDVSSTGMGAQAAGEVRGVLEGLISRALPDKNVAPFKALNQQWGLTQDIKRIYRAGGGEGGAEASGFLDPSKIQLEAGTGPVTSMTDDAARLINKFKVRNHANPNAGGNDMVGIIKDVAQGTVGKIGNALDVNFPNAPSSVKHVIEGLRAFAQRAPQNLYQNRENNNAP